MIVDGRIQNAADEAAKKMNRQFAPDAAIAGAVEDLLRYGFEQRIRSGEVDKRIALIVGDELGAAFDELCSVVI